MDYKKRNDCKLFHLSANLIDSDSDIDEAFKSIHQSINTEIKNYASEDWIFLDVILKHGIKLFEWLYKDKNSIKNGDTK